MAVLDTVPSTVNVGSIVRQRREALRLPVWSAAQRAGISPDTLRRIESGRAVRRPQPAVLRALGDALQLDLTGIS